MKKARVILYSLETLLSLILICALFSSKLIRNRILISVIILIFTFIVLFVIKNKQTKSIYRKKVRNVLIILALLYIGVFYTLGIYAGFYKATIKLSFWSLFNYIIPLTIIIVCTEVMRSRFLNSNAKFSKVLTVLIGVLIDLLLYTNIYNLNMLDNFLYALGYVTFASISCNLLYNYLSNNYGYQNVIIYRLITTLYLYIIPITPDIYIFFNSFYRMIYPILIYLVIDNIYGTKKEKITSKDKRTADISIGITLVILTLFIMLISCQFTYGTVVVGSGSMTGTIDKGDAVIYKRVKDLSKVDVGEIIIFKRDNIKIVHRVIAIKKVNGEYRYYTKGDNNNTEDEGFVDKESLIGKVQFKVKKIGLPTLWLHEMFERER